VFQEFEVPKFHDGRHMNVVRLSALCIGRLYRPENTGCFKKSFTTLKAYRNLYRGHTQGFELSKCSKTHRVLPRIVIRNCFDLFFLFLLYGKKEVEMELDSAAI
jgi:hypothetical protein